MSANLENSVVVKGLEKVSFHSNPKEGQCQRMFQLPYKYAHFDLLARLCSKSFKIASAIHELRTSRYKSWVSKSRGTRDQIANICWIIEKAREFQKNIYFCSIDYAKAFACVTQNKLWKILKYLGTPDHLTYLLKNLCEGQEAIVRTRHGTTDRFKIGKEVCEGVYCHPP